MLGCRLPNALCCTAVMMLSAAIPITADDWPMWRYDASRSAASPNALDAGLQLQWEKKLPSRAPAWDDPLNQDLMTYDRLFEPIVMGGRLFVGFNDSDKIVAMDADTGRELWKFFTEAPVRMPPVGSNGNVYVTSDDGCLYCIDATNGELVWKFNGAPDTQHAIGNRRLTSAWPARGGAVVCDDTVYFATSIWPFMGTFLYALDAQSGEVRWINDRTGSQYIKQPHSAPSFAGVAPQGAIAATDSLLVVPGGRSVPAVFDRKSGELRYFELNAGGKGTGGSFVATDAKHFYVHTREKGTRAFTLSDGLKTAFMPNEPVLKDGIIYSAETIGEKRFVRAYGLDEKLIWEIEADGSGDLIGAGKQLVAAGAGKVTIIDLPRDDRTAQVSLVIQTDRQIERLMVADRKVFGVTIDGHLMAFGRAAEVKDGILTPGIAAAVASDVAQASAGIAAQLLSAGDAQGYAFWFGDCLDDRLTALAQRSPFSQLAIVDSDVSNIARARRDFDAAGLYGSVTVHHGVASRFKAPHYVAHFVFVDDCEHRPDAEITAAYQSVRPYGGVMYLLASEGIESIAKRIAALGLEQADVSTSELGVIVRRQGALPGAADWTHQYGDIANTVKSNDSRVKLPLGVLWFGGSSNMDVLPRHGHGPPEQVVGGRLFIQGMNSLSARDVYTGRVLWKREFDDLGTYDVFYDTTYENLPLDPKYNQVHIPGANARGTNFVVADDRVYIVEGAVCHALDPASGETLTDFRMPVAELGQDEQWGYIGVYKDVLIGGLGFASYRDRNQLKFDEDKKLSASKAGFGSKSFDRAASVALVGFDRHSGEQLWKVDAKHSFWHNGVVAGAGKLFCLDRTPKQVEEALLRRGISHSESYRIVALDVLTGEQLWQRNENIFGTWLGYSEQHDLLLQAGAKASDRLSDEVAQGMAVYHGIDGTVKWSNDSLQYSGPCILHNDSIITNANAYSESAGAFYLETGQPKLIRNPLTGEEQPWKITRAYGCNSIIASENLLTFRSGAAGFYDLLTDSGTGNLGGFKSGCTANLVVANGVLNAPDYTRTCSCSYQNQTSLALVHMPDVDTWSIHNGAAGTPHGEQLDHLAINFGAPGDRRDVDGALWLEYPVVAGDSPPLTIDFNQGTRFFQRHSSAATASIRPWVSASGATGVTDLRIELKLKDSYDLTSGLPVASESDDAEQTESGKVDLTSSDLELTEDTGTQIVGLRFQSIPIARGTAIRSAFLQFTCDEASTRKTSLIIAAEDTADAATFSEQSHDLSARTMTRAEIGWNVQPWKTIGAATAAQRSPDLASLVQAIINRDDWQPGNSLAFQISGSGKRIAASTKGGPEKAVKLMIDAETTAPPGTKDAQSYEVTLSFPAPETIGGAAMVFDVYAQGVCVGKDVTTANSDKNLGLELNLANVMIGNELHLQFVPTTGEPVLSGIQIKRN